MMLVTYVPPTKWYRREQAWHFKIPYWPDWLARRLCDHKVAEAVFDQWCGIPKIGKEKKISEVEALLDREAKDSGLAIPCPDCGMFVVREDSGEVVNAFKRK